MVVLPEVALRIQGPLLQRCASAVVCLAIFVCTVFACLPARATSEDDAVTPDLLTVDGAIKIALANNRDLKIVSLNVDSSKDSVLAAKTKRLPAFSIYTFGSQLLSPISFQVPAGQFGSYPGIGPIPAVNTNITTPSQPTAYIFATASQPLLTLYKINLHVHGEELSLGQSVGASRRAATRSSTTIASTPIVEFEKITCGHPGQHQAIRGVGADYRAI